MSMSVDLKYMNGFGNEFQSEAPGYEGAIPSYRINPQNCEYGLFSEQISGSAFTAPRIRNRRSWFYRFKPSVCHTSYERLHRNRHRLHFDGNTDPNQKRWKPFESKDLDGEVNFIQGLHTLAYSDAPGSAYSYVSIHVYLANRSMGNKCMVNSDGDFLIVPQQGILHIETEFGKLIVEPNEIVVIQQGMKFSINFDHQTPVRGYVLEVKGNHFELPNLGPIGANCLANPRDFQIPVARVDVANLETEFEVYLKFRNEIFHCKQGHTPYDVAGWFGNYTPYKYSLDRFVSVNSVSVDHPDPSIFTVLTCPLNGKPGTALADFVIFPPRWECATDTFRPPYYHRNCMTEFMGLIKGEYQAKSKSFAPGGGSLHQSMVAHGPDEECFKMASTQDTSVPRRVADGTMAFMFETCMTLKLSNWAATENVDDDYTKCWQGLAKVHLTD